MKTFRYTVPEFPLSKVEKRDRERRGGPDRIDDAPFLSSAGEVTEEGRDYLAQYQKDQLGRLSRYGWYFMKQKAMVGFVAAVVICLLFGGVFALLTGDASVLVGHLKQIPVCWLAFVAVSSMRMKKSWREASELFGRLKEANTEVEP